MIVRVILAALACVALAGVGVLVGSEVALRRTYVAGPERAFVATAGSRVEGARLAKLYGCTSCHGPSYQGGLYNDDPGLVRNFAPNLTLAARDYSDRELAQAIRQGISPRTGRALWNMPSATFSTLKDDELADVVAHLRGFPPAGNPTPGDAPGLRARVAIVLGQWRSADDPGPAARRHVQRPAPALVRQAGHRRPVDLGPAHAVGRHLTMTICSECHGSDLDGDAVEGGPALAVAASYDLSAFRTLMRTGRPPGGRDLGIMTETAREDLRVLSDAEIAAIHRYLRARALAPL